MAAVVEMPKLSDTMEEGAIAKWAKSEGETVKEGETLVEIETDKATMEYPSPESGVLLKILVPPGKAVALNAPIAIVGKKGETVDLDAMVKGKAATPSQKQTAKAPTGEPAKTTAPVVPEPSRGTGERLRASPLAKKVAKESGVDLNSVTGSGPSGRVVLRDIEQAKANVSSGSTRTNAASRSDKTVALSMMRKTIAKRLTAAKNEAPHYYLTVSAQATQLNQWRERLNKTLKDGDQKISVNDLLILLVARSLRRHPQINASWQNDSIIEYGNVDVAMAVALPTGLVTPVIRHTDSLGVREIAQQTRQLAAAAKAGTLQNEDYQGGTFTISNLGMFGIEEFTAIINPPQAAILAVGAAAMVPWVTAEGQIVAQSRMKMTMSCDHRVIDGAMGAQFLQTLVKYIEDPLHALE